MFKVKRLVKSIIWRKRNKHNYTTLSSDYFPLDKVTVGRYSYGPVCAISSGVDDERLEIGDFCSIADNVVFLLSGEHSMDKLFTYPIQAKKFGTIEALTNGPIVLEDDVWIGYGATILSGVRIGRGSVIAARSLVSKDVEPYAIVGGIPAKIIRYRFSKDIRERLCKLNFKLIDDSFLTNKMSLFESTLDVNLLKDLESILT